MSSNGGGAVVVRALVVTLALTSLAWADSNRDVAKGHFKAGSKLFEAQRYKEALAEFRTAYELAPLPELLFNIARCQEYLEDIAGAVRTYDQYLATVAPSPEKKEVEVRVGELRRMLLELPPSAVPPEPKEQKGATDLTAPPARPAEKKSSKVVVIVAVVAAVVVVGAGVGIGVGVAASQPKPVMLDFPALMARP
jgi:hypothetical protein